MSESSIDSLEKLYARRCHCGLNALNLTAWTDLNAGRRFYKCPRPKATSCGYWEWQDKQQLPPREVTVIMDLKGKLDVMKVERNKLKRIVDGMEKAERDNLEILFEETKFISAQEAGKVMLLEKKIKKLKTIIFISCALFVVFVVRIMK
ncbi:hypothetical protein KY290_029726 [Solanum tuberosum]|uniref:GRF-type domain-containing protein n=1 Tax=Solanum tuberosum TaxID=4113 RepID=A0ABQ7ULK0_SOLTU|nr:hypothetical protein KY289_028947 [Solanum tuberosum]KAH0663851.1 hypothetical protein KY284_028782 [Solanum tuberosum]KAH0667543.1 hypothetical protein KY285_028749 [Solanum tuberosum]KAH0750494.1 hypothetical protein KY290_029726 [Solanum tuberosum]